MKNVITSAATYWCKVDYRILSRKNGFELGAAWVKAAKSTGPEYIPMTISAH